jgi:iron complex outermembrane receptor protein
MLTLAPHLARGADSADDAAGAVDTTATDTLRRVVQLPEVVVSTARADAKAPLALTIVKRDELRERNWGQDTPMALATLPGAYAYSDAGNGIGYSYLSIRGFPQRRISVLVNGVPLNDPESHEVYWIDHPDLLASTSEAQMQRGVGSALYGAASLGGSVNLETGPLGDAPSAAAAIGYGSYDTRRVMVEGLSGPLAGGWVCTHGTHGSEAMAIAISPTRSCGRTRSRARKQVGAHSFRLNLYGGPQETHLAYLGVPPLRARRRSHRRRGSRSAIQPAHV